MATSPATKRCPQCKEEKPREEFNRNASKNDGLQYACRPCGRASIRECTRKWRATHPDEALARDRAYKVANAEKIRTRARALYTVSVEKVRARKRAWRVTNVGKESARHRAYQVTHPEKHRARQAKRRALKRATLDPTTDQQAITELHREAMLASQFMGTPFHVDHVQALSRGGLHTDGNMQSLSAAMNMAKGTMTHAEALERVSGYRGWTEGAPTYAQATFRSFHPKQLHR